MKKMTSLLLVLALLVTGWARADAGTSIQLQNDQIISDLKRGLIKPTEAQKLLQHLDRIKSELKRAQSDGHVNPYETRKLNFMLTENAKALLFYRQKRK
jgi:hypothetical protein